MSEQVLPHFFAQPLRAAAFMLLFLSLLSVWLTRWSWITPASLLLALFFGWQSGWIGLVGIVSVVIFWRVTELYYEASGTLSWRRAIYCVLMLAGVALLLSGAVPGFTTWVLASRFRIVPDASPMSMKIRMSGPAVAIVLLYWQGGLARSRSQWRSALLCAAVAIPVLILILAGSALAVHFVAFEPKLPQLSWIRLPGVLFTACLEEAIFRGFLQSGLIAAFSRFKIRRPAFWGWVVASVIFGLGHMRFGLLFVALATIAGLFYGGVFIKSKRIESAILTHFWVDALHFLLFTYPSYSPALRHL